MRRAIACFCLLILSLGMLSATTVAGKVVDPDGKPIPNASLLLFYGENRKQLRSSADGTYTTEFDLPPDQQGPAVVNAHAFAKGYAVIQARLNADENNVITLTPDCQISGIVTDPTGAPVAGVTVCLDAQHSRNTWSGVPDEWRQDFSIQSAADGSWSVPGTARDGEVFVVIDDDCYIHVKQVCTTTDGRQSEAVHLTARPGATLTGRILAPDGTPDSHASVWISSTQGNYSDRGYTNEDGRYRITGIAPGSYQLDTDSLLNSWIADPLEHLALKAGTETTAPDVQTHCGAILDVEILDADTGLPIPDACFNCFSGNTFDDESIEFSAIAYDNGHFTFHMKPKPAQLSLLVDQPTCGYCKQMDSEAVPITLQEGKTSRVTVKLHKGLALAGMVKDTKGNPAAGVTFSVYIPCGKCTDGCHNDTLVQVVTDAQGQFTASGLPAGKGILSIENNPEDEDTWEMTEPVEYQMPAQAPLTITVRHAR